MSSTTFQVPSGTTRDWPVLAAGAALALALVFLFHTGLADLWLRWGERQELSHSYFIPVITLWMLWDRRDALQKSMGAPNPLGYGVLALSALLAFGYETTHIFLLQHLGLFLSFFGVALLVGGISLTWVTFFPLAYLVFMIPPPYWIITETSWQFQLWSSQLGVAMIRLFGVPVLLEGNVIDLGVMKLQVVEACSGLRYLFPFLSLGALAAYFYRGPIWQRLLIVASVIPITIVMNSLRIAVTGVLSASGDASHTEGFLHFFEGWVVFLMCIALLLGVIVAIARLSGRKNVLATLGLPNVEPVAPAKPFDRKKFVTAIGIAAVGTTLFATFLHTRSDAFQVPEREQFSSLPLEFPGWKVQEQPIDVATEQVLGADDYIVMDLVSPQQERFNLYIAYLDSQRDGNSWHSPRQCLPGGGWLFEQQEIIPRGEANPLGFPYNRLVMASEQSKFLVYYWYEQRGRYFADEIMMKLGLIWDVATKRRSDGAMVRLMTPVSPDETLEQAERRLQSMAQDVQPTLTPYIPD